MVDIVDTATRSRMMSGIKSKNTKPELLIRKRLHKQGFRYRLHAKDLPGKPDIVLPRFKVVIFVHGCFWHGHDCPWFKVPNSRQEFWLNKIHRNQENDRKAESALVQAGWRIATIWECSIRDKSSDMETIIKRLAEWILGDSQSLDMRSQSTGSSTPITPA